MADILHMVAIKAPPAKIFAALSEQSGLAGWWTQDVQAEPKVGTIAKFRFRDGMGPDMQILTLEQDKFVRWRCVANSFGEEWVNTELDFDLRPENGNTVVRFSHRGWLVESDFLRFCSLKWATFLLSLKHGVEAGRGEPWPRDVET